MKKNSAKKIEFYNLNNILLYFIIMKKQQQQKISNFNEKNSVNSEHIINNLEYIKKKYIQSQKETEEITQNTDKYIHEIRDNTINIINKLDEEIDVIKVYNNKWKNVLFYKNSDFEIQVYSNKKWIKCTNNQINDLKNWYLNKPLNFENGWIQFNEYQFPRAFMVTNDNINYETYIIRIKKN